jgi:hypothetical protein
MIKSTHFICYTSKENIKRDGNKKMLKRLLSVATTLLFQLYFPLWKTPDDRIVSRDWNGMHYIKYIRQQPVNKLSTIIVSIKIQILTFDKLISIINNANFNQKY